MSKTDPVHDIIKCDVAIIGGGPGGSTCGSLLRKYDPRLQVCIFEKERFPREHIGESQLPPIGEVLHEMGCWDKVEAANFPIKVGATFRWGRTPELWDFEFLPVKTFKQEPRPGRYEGQRRQTAWQVERAIYDDILLRHAAELGCAVHEESHVIAIDRDGDHVTGLQLRDGRRVIARHYVDASGHVGILRRAMGVRIDVPTKLMNIAIWNYWDKARWAVEIGIGATRIQVMSVSDGWLWFIPIGPTRASLGFVCPAEYYRSLGKTPEALYDEVVRRDDRIARLIKDAHKSDITRTTKDWSFVSDRCVGENWFLVGEAAGFADPILSAGLTLTHTGARELAYTILELDRGAGADAQWLKSCYCRTQRARVRQHIRFADYWYACNGQLSDLKAHCAMIARDSGMPMAPDAAWRWIAQGGFSNDVLGQPGLGGYGVGGIKQTLELFSGRKVEWKISTVNVFRLALNGAETLDVPQYVNGHIERISCYRRGENILPLTGFYRRVVDTLHRSSEITEIMKHLRAGYGATMSPDEAGIAVFKSMQCLEVMLAEGWVTGKLDPRKPRVVFRNPDMTTGRAVHLHDFSEEQAADT